MKTLITILAIVCFTGIAFASTFEAVTPDGKETDIGKVKVREMETISAEDLAILQKHQPDFTAPASKMHRLELIDEDIAQLQAEADAITEQIVEKVILRGKVDDEAKKVVLKVE